MLSGSLGSLAVEKKEDMKLRQEGGLSWKQKKGKYGEDEEKW